jgi:hypothetical protein
MPKHYNDRTYRYGAASKLQVTYLWLMMSLYGQPLAKAMAKLTFMDVAGRLITLQGISRPTLSVRDIWATKANFMEHTRSRPARVLGGKFSGSLAISFV